MKFSRLTLGGVAFCLSAAYALPPALAAGPNAAPADPLLFASGNLTFAQNASGAVRPTVHIIEAQSNDAAQFPGLHIDSQAISVRYRRVDQTVRPWQALQAAVPAAHDIAPGGQEDLRFKSFPALPGATYEFALGLGTSITWAGNAPTIGTFDDLQNTLSMACGGCGESAAQALSGRDRIVLLTLPSAPRGTFSSALAALSRDYAGRHVRVMRGGLAAHVDFSSPHASAYNEPLRAGTRLTVTGVAALQGTVTTTTPALGIAPEARIPQGTPRLTLDGIDVSLGPVTGIEGDSYDLVFASAEEVRLYLGR